MRLIGPEGEQIGVVSIADAQSRAQTANLDLVEVAPNAEPPVCRVMDFGKFKYEQAKKEKTSRKKQAVIHVKEIRFRPKIDDHDFDFKSKHARTFIEEGDKVKATVSFRGREMVHKEFGIEVIKRLEEILADIAKPERPAQQEGRNLVVYFVKK